MPEYPAFSTGRRFFSNPNYIKLHIFLSLFKNGFNRELNEDLKQIQLRLDFKSMNS